MNCACKWEGTKVVSMCAAHHAYVRQSVTPAAPDGEDLLGVDIPLSADPKDLPRPCCPRCGSEIPAFYAYLYKTDVPQGLLLIQAFCCPRVNCRALVMVQQLGVQAKDGIAAPGRANWPGH